jgi:hypothetical protein
MHSGGDEILSDGLINISVRFSIGVGIISVDFIGEIFSIGGRAFSNLLTNVLDRFVGVVSIDLSSELFSIDGVEKFLVCLSNVLDRIIESATDVFSMDGEIRLSIFLSKVLDRVIIVGRFLVLVGM